ncbi:50S ribosomal protein L29 [Gottschalkiaceae bacterium SANA]|jgi:large subunit ribosomal protein L29|nr:50S ribosomal protein L29 [Gottschalkiaceae bacterium SANA]
MLKAKDLREMTAQELAEKLNEYKAELFQLRFQLATGQLDNAMRIKSVKRDIARVQTVAREKELNA